MKRPRNCPGCGAELFEDQCEECGLKISSEPTTDEANSESEAATLGSASPVAETPTICVVEESTSGVDRVAGLDTAASAVESPPQRMGCLVLAQAGELFELPR